MEKNNTISKEVKRLNSLFQQATAANFDKGLRSDKKECEEFYYDDVRFTLSQFTTEQKKKIDDTYNMPISTKFCYSIIEQMLSLLTANKPYPKLISAEESSAEWVETYTKLFHSCWYESKGENQIKNANKDRFNTGCGYVMVRRAGYYDEATTNVVFEYKGWKHFFVDPESTREDFSDASYMIYADIIRKDKAERIYDVTFEDDAGIGFGESGFSDLGTEDFSKDLYGEYITGSDATNKKHKYYMLKEFYELKEINVYIGENGEVSALRPEPTEAPNKEKEVLGQQIQQLQQQLQAIQPPPSESTSSGSGEVEGSPQEESQDMGSEMPQEGMEQQGGMQQQPQQEDQSNELQMQLNQMMEQFTQMPDMVPAFILTLAKVNKGEEPETTICYEVVKSTRKRILRTLVINNKKIDSEYIPTDQYPIIGFPFVHFNNPNRMFGVTHFIKDLNIAMNKYVSEIMYDISVNGHQKAIFWDNTIPENFDIEQKWSQIGTAIKLKRDYAAADGGAPTIMPSAPLPQSITYMLDYFKTLIEYITGIYGVMQGDPGSAPSTFGATQSMQNFGSQRLKLYSRQMEHSLEHLAYVVICYLQAYTDRDKVIKYFDYNGDEQEVKTMSTREDIRFKVRVDITSFLPSIRQQVAQQLMFVAQTLSDDNAKILAMEYMLKIQDLSEAKEFSEQISIVKKLQSQIQQMSEQLKQAQTESNTIKNQLEQKDISNRVTQAQLQAQNQIDVEKQKQIDAMQPVDSEPEDPFANLSESNYEF